MFIGSDATDDRQLRQERHVWLVTLLTELIFNRINSFYRHVAPMALRLIA